MSDKEHEEQVKKTWSDIWDKAFSNAQSIKRSKLRLLIKKAIKQFSISRIVSEILIKEIGNVKGKEILEAGSGTGQVSLELAKLGANVTLLDVSFSAIILSKQLFVDLSPKGQFICASIFDIPFDNESFDVVWNAGVLEHFYESQQEIALTEMCRVLKKGGLLITLNPYDGGSIYKFAKQYAEKHKLWDVGYEKPISTLKDICEHIDGLEFIEEYSRGFLIQFVFFKHLFSFNPFILKTYILFCEIVNKICWSLNRFPGYLLITVCCRK
jgi:ubiquinone/menaquinone biosynthesis C-methylase UbiE